MKKLLILSTFLFGTLSLFAQRDYWQQEVNFSIEVKLDDQNHILRGYETIEYINNSPDTLQYVFLHLHPNAYKNDHTPFAIQQVENGSTDFYYADKNQRGFIDSLQFKVDGFPVNVNTYNNQIDIKLIELVEPLLPGKSISISTPFRVVIPKNFSRLGHEGQTYQITQWFPKPAVYDADGWHPMSYLDQGEFFSEYGSFDVTIEVPKNYVVAATGDLQTEAEKEFRKTRIVQSKADADKMITASLAESSSTYKKIRFTQQNVHDFAWFADKSFLIEKTDFNLPSGKSCSAFSYYTPSNYALYRKTSKVLAETAKYLSKHVGEYPYKHISVVDGPLYAGGGMEYPNIAIIGKIGNKKDLNSVIIHEAGHNWFQGILGSNERKHPWLDEGVNTFYENKIEAALEDSELVVGVSDGNDIVYFLNGHDHKDQPIEYPSEKYTDWNYGGVVYAKAAKSLFYLQDYIGEVALEKSMKAYYKQWAFKHPKPSDFRYFIEQNTTKDVSWYFDQLMNSAAPIDFKITKVMYKDNWASVQVKEKQGAGYPVPVFAMSGDQVVEKQYTKDGVAAFKKLNNEVTHFIIDKNNIVPDIKLSNNIYKLGSLLKRGAPKLSVGSRIGKNTYNKIFVLPSIGFNHYDRVMPGLLIHNLTIPNQAFQYAFSPMYSFRTKSLNGTGLMSYHFFPKKGLRKISISVQGQSFHFNESDLNVGSSVYPRFWKIQPRIRAELPIKDLRKKITRSIELSYFTTGAQSLGFTIDPTDSLFKPALTAYDQRQFARIEYAHINQRTFNPFSYKARLEGNLDWAKLGGEAQLKINYFMKKKALYVRTYAGKFFYVNNNANRFALRPYFLNTTVTAENDYGYENAFLGRSEFSGWKSQQVMNREGGFVTRTTQLSNPLGQSDDWLFAINLRSDIPLKFPILPQLFLNAATFGDAGQTNPSGAKMLFEGGLSLNLFKGLARVSLPLVLSKDLKDYTQSIYTKNRIPRQVSFTLNTHLLDFTRTQNATQYIMTQ